ncbi:TPA: DNA cytosine methyltransferase [Vibrio parahaemolyticus]|nr:DNA cytosine methyltransferase [Vibrio parahaemolyticus]
MASIFSFFTGSGFLDLGFEKAGFKIATVNEYHPSFMDAYKHSRKIMGLSEPMYGYYRCSVEDFDGEGELAVELQGHIQALQKQNELVGFIGGPPCPDFSVGGKNKGQDGDNGRLSQTYVNTIIQHQPDFFLFENVKGLWRTKRHREFYDKLKDTLSNSGYELTDKLVNCIQYGAPQDRDRILLFGVKKTHLNCIQNDFLNKSLEELFNWDSYIVHSRDSVFDRVKWPTTQSFSEGSYLKAPQNVIEELTVEHWFNKNNVEDHPNSKAFFKPKSDKFKTVEEGDTSKKSFKRLHRWRYSPTAAYGNNEVHLHPYKARRLSASEALAIQSLPTEFELPSNMTLSDMFKTIGNGVPYVAAFGVAKTIKDFLEKLS